MKKIIIGVLTILSISIHMHGMTATKVQVTFSDGTSQVDEENIEKLKGIVGPNIRKILEASGPKSLPNVSQASFEWIIKNQDAIIDKFVSFISEMPLQELHRDNKKVYYSIPLAADYLNITPLSNAVRKLNRGILFSENKSDIKALLEFHKSHPTIDVVNLHPQDSVGKTPLIQAAEKGDKDIVELLIEAGANLNHQSGSLDNSRTALISAIEEGHKDIVELLINAGANLNLKNHDNETAIMIATIENYTEIAELLINAGAELNHQSKRAMVFIDKPDGYTALMLAAHIDQKEIAGLLINKGADLNLKNTVDENALMLAVEADNKDIASLLINAGADLNALHRSYGSALTRALRIGHKDIAKLLINAGTDLTLQNSSKETALQIATKKGYKEIVELLKKHGAQ